ncbi:hypothetical protein EO244_07685 [Ancylomarina salipaludis]|uniref:Uncharacterized protein n=1 Tax=Ancylomarina salipaludis TaxID=2501299 RepID=A0A4Q1JNN0_9BACT|nr:TatD family hydrolase [Ancylomarina salipaludis]RXQ95735.1 hypothetical protein EO244_07685 [Ancylomarina salipaludis]
MPDTPYINIHTHQMDHTDGVISVLNVFPEKYMTIAHTDKLITVGVHPWHLEKKNADVNLELVKEFASKPNVMAIGEIGLDRAIKTPLNLQETFFTKQIEIAETYKKPIIVHAVRYFPELISIKKRVQASTPWLIHGFRNNMQIAQELLKHNCFISFGEALLFDQKVQNIFIEMPINRLFLETDESKHSIVEIYEKAASLKKMQLAIFKIELLKNYNTVFKKHI